MITRKLAIARKRHDFNLVRHHIAASQNPINARTVRLQCLESIERAHVLVLAFRG
jgi:hypothetical protein